MSVAQEETENQVGGVGDLPEGAQATRNLEEVGEGREQRALEARGDHDCDYPPWGKGWGGPGVLQKGQESRLAETDFFLYDSAPTLSPLVSTSHWELL